MKIKVDSLITVVKDIKYTFVLTFKINDQRQRREDNLTAKHRNKLRKVARKLQKRKPQHTKSNSRLEPKNRNV
jgi:hypothetical protein